MNKLPKPTCTFPEWKHKVLHLRAKIANGDEWNLRNPSGPENCLWEPFPVKAIGIPIRDYFRGSFHRHVIVIRPLKGGKP